VKTKRDPVVISPVRSEVARPGSSGGDSPAGTCSGSNLRPSVSRWEEVTAGCLLPGVKAVSARQKGSGKPRQDWVGKGQGWAFSCPWYRIAIDFYRIPDLEEL